MAKKPKTQTISIESAVSDAFSGMEELKDELQNWLDNMPENMQQGSKADQLNEAIDAIECVSSIDVPDCLSTGPSLPDVTYSEYSGSRAKRRDTFTSMLSGAADAAREYADELRGLEYHEETGTLTAEQQEEGWPEDDDTRNTWVDECDTFADECENAQSEYDGVEFPGQRG